MSRTTKDTSMFSRALGFFKSRPSKVKKRSARKSNAGVLSKKNKQVSRTSTARFRAAEIEFDDCACEAVKAMQGQRLLVRDVPRLPLPDCDKPSCQCSYVRYKDRRIWTEDRRAFYSLKTSHYIQGDGKERRKVQDRRAADESAGGAPDSLDDMESWFK
jgi:hypothetical protein